METNPKMAAVFQSIFNIASYHKNSYPRYLEGLGIIPKMKSPPIPRVNILGVKISSINMPVALAKIEEWIKSNTKFYVCVTPIHSVMDCFQNPELRTIFNSSGMTTPDGMGIVWLLKLMGHHHVGRVYGPDLMQAVCKLSLDNGWSHYFYGGAPGVAEQLSSNLLEKYPGLKVAGFISPPFGSISKAEDYNLSNKLNEAKPDIIWVGISSPKQEQWMAQHREILNAPVLIGVGAAFDFLSGGKKQAPLWVQRSGLEWLFRLTQEPKRLWRRYILYPRFMLLVGAQCIGLIKYP
jgi:N-acetylglucosaminyldiphosphoundecaprenol N-acetyl-beta-D-mannosaminyltransferase